MKQFFQDLFDRAKEHWNLLIAGQNYRVPRSKGILTKILCCGSLETWAYARGEGGGGHYRAKSVHAKAITT